MRRLLGNEAPPPLKSAGGGAGSDNADTNYDTNMVIILAALLCALICALGLNSIVRCALRCSRRLAFETPEEAATRLAATGLKKRALRRIPIAVYARDARITETECPICLGDFADGQKVRVLPKCNHGFHVRCIDTWLASHSSCPTCRRSLLDRSSDDRPDPPSASGGRRTRTEEVAVAVAAAAAAVAVDEVR